MVELGFSTHVLNLMSTRFTDASVLCGCSVILSINPIRKPENISNIFWRGMSTDTRGI